MFNVYVRDNSSGSIALDNEKLTLKHGFNYQVNSSNMGYAYSINNLINDSVEDAILFMSDDDQIIEDGFIKMLHFVQSNLSSSPILLPYVKTSLEKSEFKLNPLTLLGINPLKTSRQSPIFRLLFILDALSTKEYLPCLILFNT